MMSGIHAILHSRPSRVTLRRKFEAVILTLVWNRKAGSSQQPLEKRLQAWDACGNDCKVFLHKTPYNEWNAIPRVVSRSPQDGTVNGFEDASNRRNDAQSHKEAEDNFFARRYLDFENKRSRDKREEEVAHCKTN
jgi:hypothetical protein